ncbi:hypothetical protein GMDG_02285 [Pseudogymnoascus destructans 20631-21]|uniref:Uncharacterized protein n=1 Tax=Pseudogymnoascus destructans (strain ATCC MYA-4855 / 20631-21) TaxID=658429 RepID=L8G0W0_PSED2|nr:hypothetical protein GMDG_02285 [Pseudogymnoascus destructans 20631-21]
MIGPVRHAQLQDEGGFIGAKTWRRKTPQKYASRRSNEIVIKPGLKSFALVRAAEDGVSCSTLRQPNGSRRGTISVSTTS